MASSKDTVAVIGTGDMGDSFGPRLAALGYQVVYGSRNPNSDKVKALLELTGHNATAATQKEAAQQADILLLAIPWPAMETVAQNLGDLSGKVVIDMSWPPSEYDADGYSRITIDTSAAELIQDWNPDALVVKAFLTVWSHVIDDPATAGGPVSIPIASDSRYAKEKTGQIAADLGLDPVDVGPLRFARNIESLTEMAIVPFSQGRDALWNIYFPRTNFTTCHGYDGDGSDDVGPPLVDADDLAVMPYTQPPLEPCPK
ncbi:MAG: NADPH-dependent F420 reductase [Woeseiaceae bacterium]